MLEKDLLEERRERVTEWFDELPHGSSGMTFEERCSLDRVKNGTASQQDLNDVEGALSRLDKYSY